MDNLKLPAYPQPLTMGTEGDILTPVGQHSDFAGFTKQEKGALIMAAALVGKYSLKTPEDQQIIAQLSNELAKAVLEEANK